jgi:hypothetical protein
LRPFWGWICVFVLFILLFVPSWTSSLLNLMLLRFLSFDVYIICVSHIPSQKAPILVVKMSWQGRTEFIMRMFWEQFNNQRLVGMFWNEFFKWFSYTMFSYISSTLQHPYQQFLCLHCKYNGHLLRSINNITFELI